MTFDEAIVWRRLSDKDTTSNNSIFIAEDSLQDPRGLKGNFLAGLSFALIKGTVVVEFTKRDGSLRVMICTLNANYIPKNPENTETSTTTTVKKKKKKDGVISVWDCEKKEWRSFRLDSITRAEYSIS